MTVTLPAPGSESAPNVLTAYVPRLVIDWLRRDPNQLHTELEGTFVFVDISGFTALSERLARKGKIGAELMRDTLDGVFRALLDEAYDWGAGLLKWGGDALLLFFSGPEHEKRACRAAWEMQRTIDRVGRLHLSSGTLTLRMSVGIGTGSFHFWLTGSIHRELLIGGPAMTETLQMEAIADATEIGITETLAKRLDPACVGPRKDAAILLAAPPEVDRRRAPDVGDTSTLDIASCIPVATRAHVLLQKSEPEHRTITAAFIDMMHTDELLAEVGPIRLGEGLDERIRQIEEAALQFEVPFYETDIGKSSVKALLTAGAPSSTGHDEERMLRTLRAVMEQPGLVEMRIGVNTGKVFTGDFGPPYRRAYRVFGDAINTAARVMAKAEGGQILSTEIVLNRSKTVFETTPIPPFAAKGKSEPVRASIVGPVIGTKADSRAELPLIGRDDELRALLEGVESTRAGNGVLVELVGESGIGKTRLLDEVVARSPDVRVLRTRAEEYESSTPYFAMRAVMRAALDLDPAAETSEVTDRLETVVAQVEPDLVPWIPLLGALLGLDLPPTPETEALDERFIRERLSEVAWAFLRKALPGPTILAVDDSHHLDESTRDLLLRLFHARGSRRAMLVLLHQSSGRLVEPDEVDLSQCVMVAVGPLSREARLEIIEAATEDAPLRPDEEEAIADRSGGNPLFLRDLIDAVRASGSIESLPDSVESLIAGEIDQLAPTDRMILRYASVLGSRFDPEMLEETIRSDVDLDDEVWDRLSALVRPDRAGGLRFQSTLIRDAAYEGLPYRRRRVLHERIGEMIEATAGESVEEEIGTLSLHFHEAQRWDKSWTYSRMAGDRAMRIYANVNAAQFYEKAVVAGRRRRGVTAADLASVYELESEARFRMGDWSTADHELAAARRLLKDDRPASAELAVKQARLAVRSGRYQQALVRVARALDMVKGAKGPAAATARAHLLVTYAGVRFFQNKRQEAIRWSWKAIRQARRAGTRDALANGYRYLDAALRESGELGKPAFAREALQIFEDLGDLRMQGIMLNDMGVTAQARSDWDAARELYGQARTLFERSGDRTTLVYSSYNLSEILTDQGRYDESEPLLREVLRVWRASGADADVAEAKRELGKMFARRGEIETGLELLLESLAELGSFQKHGEALSTRVRVAEAYALAGQTAEATSTIEASLRDAEIVEGGKVFLPILERLSGWTLVQSGETAEALSTFRRALKEARRRNDLFEMALNLDAIQRVQAANGVDASAATVQRDALFERLGIVSAPQFPSSVLAD